MGEASTGRGAAPIRRLYVAQLLTHTALWFRNVAIALVLVDLTRGATALGWASVAQFLPILLLGPFPGRWVDRVGPRRALLLVSGVSAGTAVALLAAPLSASVVWLLLATLAVGGVAQAAERPATFALTAQVVTQDQLGSQLARLTTAAAAGRFAGPGLAGFAYAAGGPRACFAATVLLSLGVLALAASIGPPRVSAPEETSEATVAAGEDAVEPAPVDAPPRSGGRDLRWVLVVGALVTVTTMSFNVTITAVVTLQFGADGTVLGLAHMLNAAGAIAGGWALSMRRRMGAAALAPAVLALGLGVSGAALAPSTTWFLVLSPLMGLTLGSYQSVLQRAAQSSGGARGTARTTSLVNMTTFGLAPVSALVAAHVADSWSPRTALGLAGLGAVAAAVVAFAAINRDGRASDQRNNSLS
ncbi:MFS transporter [Aeromicrobium sp. CF3.5]|uniref:MFS transporter n=1 Tax=Aeromicrobium sp. CF3.5 TaxID=3373078 RepID=UPI003EE732A9